jgi:hypothetical protein
VHVGAIALEHSSHFRLRLSFELLDVVDGAVQDIAKSRLGGGRRVQRRRIGFGGKDA